MLKADLKLNLDKLNNLAASTQGIAQHAAEELSEQVVQEAKNLSRVDKGDMQKGWTRQKIGAGKRGGYRIYNTVPYTVFNEYGTHKMSPQPMLGPAMNSVIPEIPAKVRKWIEIGCNQFVNETGDTLGDSSLNSFSPRRGNGRGDFS